MDKIRQEFNDHEVIRSIVNLPFCEIEISDWSVSDWGESGRIVVIKTPRTMSNKVMESLGERLFTLSAQLREYYVAELRITCEGYPTQISWSTAQYIYFV